MTPEKIMMTVALTVQKGFPMFAAIVIATLYVIMLVCVCREFSKKDRYPKGFKKEQEELHARVEAQLAQRRRK